MKKPCSLCDGDEWITDTFDFLHRLRSQDEEYLFMERVGSLGGAMAGRMVCPRCRPDWEPKPIAPVLDRAKP